MEYETYDTTYDEETYENCKVELGEESKAALKKGKQKTGQNIKIFDNIFVCSFVSYSEF